MAEEYSLGITRTPERKGWGGDGYGMLEHSGRWKSMWNAKTQGLWWSIRELGFVWYTWSERAGNKVVPVRGGAASTRAGAVGRERRRQQGGWLGRTGLPTGQTWRVWGMEDGGGAQVSAFSPEWMLVPPHVMMVRHVISTYRLVINM